MKPVKPHVAISFAFVIFFLQACYCTSIPYVVCQQADGSTYTWGLDDLWGADSCPGDDFEVGTTFNYVPTAVPTPVPAQLPQGGTNNIVAPTGGLNCNNLRLTSPLGGLPNGTATFYWDALQGAVAYRINLYDNSGNFLASFDAQQGLTNLTADVSWGAIGGQYDIQVELVAFGGGTSCRRTVTIPREAPSGGVPSGGGGGNGGGGGPQPTATLTCALDPRPECIK